MKPLSNENENIEQEQPQFEPFTAFSFETYQALLQDRTILFNGEVKQDIIERVVLPLNSMAQKSNKPIKLLIHSSGGGVEEGQAVVDAILTCSAPVITVVLGKAMSAAFDIFLAGSYRIAYPNSVFMCHSGSAMLDRQTLPAINAEAKLHEEYFKRWSKWYSSRTKISEKEWHGLLSSGLNRYFFPEEALDKGLIHEIISPVKEVPISKIKLQIKRIP